MTNGKMTELLWEVYNKNLEEGEKPVSEFDVGLIVKQTQLDSNYTKELKGEFKHHSLVWSNGSEREK